MKVREKGGRGEKNKSREKRKAEGESVVRDPSSYRRAAHHFEPDGGRTSGLAAPRHVAIPVDVAGRKAQLQPRFSLKSVLCAEE